MKKFGRIIIALLPMIGAFLLHVVLTMGLMLADAMKGMEMTDVSENEAYLSEIANKELLFFYGLGIVLFGLWYWVGARKTRYQQEKPLLSVKSVISILILGTAIQFFIIALLRVVNEIAPNLIGAYQKNMEEAQIGAFTVQSVIKTALLAPITEELIFRGMSIHFLKKGELNFYQVNILQAVFFGIYHMQLVQGIYAALIGLVLGYLYYKYNSILIPMLVHMVVNLSGILIQHFGLPISDVLKNYYIMGGISLGFVLLAFIIIWSDKGKIDTKAYSYE